MSKSQIHDFLVIIDTETILKKYPPNTSGEPIEIAEPEGLITFFSPDMPAAPYLFLDGAILDIIRMREQSILRNTGAAALFYDFDINPRAELMTRPMPIVYSCIASTLGRDLLKPGAQRLDHYLWQSTVVDTGLTTGTYSFLILKAAGDEFRILGRYFWSFTINIGFDREEER